jgi:hypothetical protein
MATQFPDPPPVSRAVPPAVSWSDGPWGLRAGSWLPGWHRFARRTAAGGVSLVLFLLLLAWIVPPMLDWGRFRAEIAAIAAAKLGRPVLIGGDVTLRLLPEAVLTATDVTLPASRNAEAAQETDGMSAQVGALRLEVSVWPMLVGRIVVRDLVLGAPVVTLPWPLPEGIAHPVRPHVPHAFAAHVENGTLHVGGAMITGITAAIHGGPELISTPVLGREAGNVAAFGAEGFATFAGRNWRFTSALGAPDADGVSAIDLAVQGQGDAGATGATIQGTLADGVIQGRLKAGGADLSQLLPASNAAWQAEAPFVATGDDIETHALRMRLAGLPAEGELVLHLARPARLDGRLHAASLDLDGWAKSLTGRRLSLPQASLPMRVELTIDQASSLGGTLQALHGVLVSDGARLRLEQAAATLPGGAILQFDGADISGDAGGINLSGPARFEAPDLRATLAWLRPLDPGLLGQVPDGVLRRASLAGMVTIGPRSIAGSAISGRVDAAAVSGGFGATLAERPAFQADVSLDRLKLEDWLGPGWPGWIGNRLAGLDLDVHVKSPSASAWGFELQDFGLDLGTASDGIHLRRLAATFAGARIAVSGAVGANGALDNVRLSTATDDLALLLRRLPAAARWLPGLWHGPASLDVTASGPLDDLSMQLRADASDLVFEAELSGAPLRGAGSATVTLRHPGAPRLLALLGMPGTEGWLDTGSLTLLAHLQAQNAKIRVQDFALAAAQLRLSGQLSLDLSGPEPSLAGQIAAENLALPPLSKLADALSGQLQANALRGWNGQVHVTAGTVAFGLQPLVTGLAADLAAGGGTAAADLTAATLAGGSATGQAAIDTTRTPPFLAMHGAITGAALPGPLTGLPVDIAAGHVDAAFDLQGQGGSVAELSRDLSGEAKADIRDGQINGFDLAALARAGLARGPQRRPALQAALSAGSSDGLAGQIGAVIDHGRIILSPARLVSGNGEVMLQGGIDAPARTLDLKFGLRPPLPDAPAFAVGLSGAWRDPHVAVDPGPAAPPKSARKPRLPHRTLGQGSSGKPH